MTPFNDNAKILGQAFKDAGHEIRLVGGAVRDFLQGQMPDDLDFCTDATPVEMMAIAVNNDMRLEPTGLQHGTVTFIINHEPFEVTTLRIDTDTDGRHADVEFTRDFRKDAERRDLTINAMSMDFDGVVYDYFNGQEDLKNGVIRFVGSAEDRIQEDYLRILRYFRFAARIENSWMNMPEDTLAAIRKHKNGLDQISRERIWQEMAKLFTSVYGVRIASLMEHEGVAEVIGLPKMTHAFSWNKRDAATIVASYWVGYPEQCRDFCKEWKMSNEETEKSTFIAQFKNILSTEVVEELLVAGYPRDWVANACHVSFIRKHAETWDIPTFPVKGQDLLDIGMSPGKEVGDNLKRMKEKWVESRFNLTKETLMESVK